MTGPDGSRRATRRRSTGLQLLATAVLLGAVAAVVAGLVPGSSARLQHASARWIAVGGVMELGACAAYAWLFHGIFSHGRYTLRPRLGAQIGLGELAGFAITPTGAGGPALRLWALRRTGMPLSVVVGRSVVHGITLQIPYVLVALVLGLGAVLGIGGAHAGTPLALAPIGVVLGAAALALLAARVARRPAHPQRRWARIGRETLVAAAAGVRETPRRLRGEPRLLAASIGYWAGDCGALVIAFTAAHGSAPLGVIVLAYMLGQLGNALPLPGGVGGVEPAMLGVLTSSGVALGLGAAAVVLYRFVSLGLQSIAGAVAASSLIPSLSEHA